MSTTTTTTTNRVSGRLSRLSPHNKTLLTGFAVGLSFGLIFAALSPNVWWAGIIGGILFGMVIGKLFALDGDNDRRMQRISRSPLADPNRTRGLRFPSDEDDGVGSPPRS